MRVGITLEQLAKNSTKSKKVSNEVLEAEVEEVMIEEPKPKKTGRPKKAK